MKKLDPHKATGLDDIPPKILKQAANDIGMHITQICNLSIDTHTFPQAWKHPKSGLCIKRFTRRKITLSSSLNPTCHKQSFGKACAQHSVPLS